MRIDPQYAPQPLPEADRRSSGQAAASSSASRLQSGEDQAQFSGAHVQVEALAAQAAQLPEIRQERVQSLRDVVRSGAYMSDPKKTAGAMVAQMISGPAA